MFITLLIGVLFILECVTVYHLFTTRFPGGNDFYAPWFGARALLREGRDPYGQDVSAEIQVIKEIDPSLRGKGKGGFSYPLYVVFTFWPLVYLPYAWAQAIWMVTLQWVTMAIVVILLRLERRAAAPLELAGIFLGALLFYPVARSIILGQFTLHVTFFLASALLALRRRRDAWAGVALAFTSIKPQMVIFIVPWIVLWAVSQRRWRFVGGLLGCSVLLGIGSLALFPRWPICFVGSMMRYSAVAGGRNPMAVLIGLFWPNGSVIVCYGLSLFLLGVMLVAWWRGWADTGKGFIETTHWTIVVSLLVLFQTGTTNQVMLLIPFAAWLWTKLKHLKSWKALSVLVALQLAVWMLFLTTIKGDWENPIMFLPLPLISLIILIGNELSNLWRSKHSDILTITGEM